MAVPICVPDAGAHYIAFVALCESLGVGYGRAPEMWDIIASVQMPQSVEDAARLADYITHQAHGRGWI